MLKKEYREELYRYFEHHITKNRKPTCENCGLPLYGMNKKNCAHIVPKSIFKSVAANLDNEMDLCSTFDRQDGYTGCHELYDSSWITASRMPVFELAKERFNKFKDQINEKHKILQNFE